METQFFQTLERKELFNKLNDEPVKFITFA